MNEFKNGKFDDFLLEKSMSRVIEHIKNHDCGMITAFRNDKDCEDKSKGTYTPSENKARNKQLEIKLNLKKYGYSKVKGVYIENYGSEEAEECKEETFFVVDINDKKTLRDDLIKFGTEYEQDSILFIENGTMNRAGSCNAELIGTNDCPNTYPGLGKIVTYKNIKIGNFNEFMTKVGNKPFYLSNDIENIKEMGNVNQWSGHIISGLGMQADANGDWRKLIEEEGI